MGIMRVISCENDLLDKSYLTSAAVVHLGHCLNHATFQRYNFRSVHYYYYLSRIMLDFSGYNIPRTKNKSYLTRKHNNFCRISCLSYVELRTFHSQVKEYYRKTWIQHELRIFLLLIKIGKKKREKRVCTNMIKTTKHRWRLLKHVGNKFFKIYVGSNVFYRIILLSVDGRKNIKDMFAIFKTTFIHTAQHCSQHSS